MAVRVVELAPRTLRDLKRLSHEAAAEILNDLELLRGAPWPDSPKVKKLRGHDLYRLRTGEYRSVFEIREAKVVILRIVARKEMERVLRTI